MTDQMNVEGLSIAPGVMETIISVAASEVDGVASLGSFATSGIRSMLASKPSTSGIETKMDEDGKLSVAVHVEVYYGYVLPELAAQLRTAIAEALAQRIIFRLTARRGSFPFWPELGSRLYQLGSLPASQRAAAAVQYVTEALAQEPVAVEDVELTQRANGIAELRTRLSYQGTGLDVTLEVLV